MEATLPTVKHVKKDVLFGIFSTQTGLFGKISHFYFGKIASQRPTTSGQEDLGVIYWTPLWPPVTSSTPIDRNMWQFKQKERQLCLYWS